ncbi:MAG: hypothetical protein V2I27_02815 [Erythrobacter sp.]|jgi:hypothetical protein|nr:hypothetical protein [Erythrobacter sp.]
MPTKHDFRAVVKDFAKLEGDARIGLGTTGFAGDGDRLFVNFDDKGILFGHEDAEAFLKAAIAAYLRLGFGQREDDGASD